MLPGWSPPGFIRLSIYVVFVSGKALAAGESTAVPVLLPAVGALPLTKSTICLGRLDQGFGTKRKRFSMLRPRPALRRADEGLKTHSDQFSNPGFIGVKPDGGRWRIRFARSFQTLAHPAQGRMGPKR